MASHLLKALSTIDPAIALRQQHYTVVRNIANEYLEWLKSKPFDVGITTRKGILRIKEHRKEYQGKSESELRPVFQQIFQ